MKCTYAAFGRDLKQPRLDYWLLGTGESHRQIVCVVGFFSRLSLHSRRSKARDIFVHYNHSFTYAH